MSEVKVNKLSPRSGTTVTLGDSGDTFAITSGASISGFTSTGIDDNATSTAITIDSSERVGIGESSPISELHITDASATAVVRLESSDSGDCRINFDDQSATDRGRIIYAHSDDSLRTEVAGSERMRIRSNGKIGLNTSSADAELHIAPISGGTNASILLANSNKSQYFRIQNNETDDALVFNANDLNERMRINSSGNVGIGETAPLGKLHIKTGDSGSSAAHTIADELVIESSGSGGLNILTGSGGNAHLSFGDSADNNIGIIQYNHSDNSLRTTVNAAERMRIANNGYIGIGTPTTTYALNISNSNGEMRIKTTDGQNVANASTSLLEYHGTNNRAGYVGFVGGDMVIHTDTYSAGDIKLQTNGSERMRIASDGHVLFNCTSLPSASVFGAGFEKNGTASVLFLSSNTTSTSNVVELFNPNGNVGTIRTSGSSTIYNTSSDYRLKENVSYDFDATTRLKQLKPARFNFIADADTTVDGFIAHEVSSIVPEAISGEKDAVNEDGSINPQGIDQSKLVPLLVKTIQELEARITTLENA